MIEAPLNSIPTWIVNIVEVCGFSSFGFVGELLTTRAPGECVVKEDQGVSGRR